MHISSYFKNNNSLYPPGMVAINLELLSEVSLPGSDLPYNSITNRYVHWELMNTPKQSSSVFELADTMMIYFWNYWTMPVEFCSSYYGGDWYYDGKNLNFVKIDFEKQWRILHVISQLSTARCSPHGPYLLKISNMLYKEDAKIAVAMLMLGIEFDIIIDFLGRDIIKQALNSIRDKRQYIRNNKYKANYDTVISFILEKEKSLDNIYLLERLMTFFNVYSDAFKFLRILQLDTKGVGKTFGELDNIADYNKYLTLESIFSISKHKEEMSAWYQRRELSLGPRKYYAYTYHEKK